MPKAIRYRTQTVRFFRRAPKYKFVMQRAGIAQSFQSIALYKLAGAVGIEPTMAGSKAAALPLGYAPIDLSAECAHKTQTPCGSIAPLYGVKGSASDTAGPFRFFGAARETRTPVRRVKANVSCIRRWRRDWSGSRVSNPPSRFGGPLHIHLC